MSHHTRVFKSGNSLAIRIPKSFDLQDQQEVILIFKKNELIVKVVPKNLGEALLSLKPFPEDMLKNGVEDLPPQDREF